MIYKGYKIEEETDEWAIKMHLRYKFQLEKGDGVIHSAYTIDDAKRQIDELTETEEDEN